MCKVCAGRDRAILEAFWNGGVDLAWPVHLRRDGFVTTKFADAFPPPDGVGDLKPPVQPVLNPAFVNTTDEAGDGIGDAPGNPVLTVGAPSTLGTLQLNGDQDFYQVTLVAGQRYEIGMYSYFGSAPPTPLPDAFIEIYDAAGNFITSADGGASTVYNEGNSGFDVLLTFTATVSGTYYVNARAYDNDPIDGTTGEGVGDYELFVREATAASYVPYYDLDSPLYALDWGSQINKIHQSARNPDGDEGPRNTGNAQGTPGIYNGPPQGVSTGNPNGFPNAPAFYDDPLVDSDGDGNGVGDGNQITYTVPGKNVITVYYARQGEQYKFDDPSQPGLTEIVPAAGMDLFEIVAMRAALAAYAEVADIVYIELDEAYVAADAANPQLGMRAYADLTILTYNGTPGTGLLGRHSPPDEGNEGQGEYNRLGPGWNATALAPGGFSFVTIIHELGHAHGLAHPHDNGGRSGVMNGVEPEGVAFDYTTGDFNLNQAIHTIMSYEDGWPMSPYGNAPTSAGYGYQTGLSAFDIAVIQDKYGVNEDFAAGNNVYVLPETNAIATYNADGSLATKATGYTTIWDAGGTDEIQYLGARDATIDLREATLRYEIGGGGWMSYTTGASPVYAGFTIANGAVIENATSGSGNDRLTGNSANNVMTSGAGNDVIFLQHGGDDTAIMGDGNDGAYFGAAYTSADIVDGGAGSLDQIGLQGDYSGGVTLGSLSGVELVVLLAGSDTRFGDTAGNFYDYNIAADAGTIVSGNKLTIQANVLRVGEDFTFNGTGSGIDFLIYGGAGNDTLTGGSGADGFFFGQGRFGAGDILNGGAGNLDQLGLQGNFAGGNAIVFGAGQLTAIEFVVLLSAADTRFGGQGGTAAYDLTMNDGNVAAGQRLVVSANTLKAGETLTFNGAAETDGSFRIFSGAGDDVITGSQNGDEIFGGLGNDIFRYTSTAESTASDRDAIRDFRTGDTIDLGALAATAGLAEFQFIGAGAQSGAGQLRIVQTGNQAVVELYVDGDATADLVIDVTVADGHTLTSADFDLAAPSGAEPLSAEWKEQDDASAAMLAREYSAPGLERMLVGEAELAAPEPALAAAGFLSGRLAGHAIKLESLPEFVHLGPVHDLAALYPGNDLIL